MAKRRRRAAAKKAPAMVCPPGKCGPGCIVAGLFSVAFKALGLWLLVAGFLMQGTGADWKNVWLWYAGGFVLWCIACGAKKKACAQCR